MLHLSYVRPVNSALTRIKYLNVKSNIKKTFLLHHNQEDSEALCNFSIWRKAEFSQASTADHSSRPAIKQTLHVHCTCVSLHISVQYTIELKSHLYNNSATLILLSKLSSGKSVSKIHFFCIVINNVVKVYFCADDTPLFWQEGYWSSRIPYSTFSLITVFSRSYSERRISSLHFSC